MDGHRASAVSRAQERRGSDHPVFPGLPALDAAAHEKSAVRAPVARDELGPVGAGQARGAAPAGFAECEPVILDWAVQPVVPPADRRLTGADRSVAEDHRVAADPVAAALADEVRWATEVG